MAAEIQEALPDAEIEMHPSRGGRFEVTVDGTAVFEKSKLGRHARAGEILGLIRAAAGPAPQRGA